MLQRIKLEQGSPEWLEYRVTKIGASDTPIIMGASPWTSPFQLWQYKLGLAEKQQTTYRMQRGTNLESLARSSFILETGYQVEPSVVVHSRIPYMMASVDGITADDKIVVEIKCPGAEDHALAKNGKIPSKYLGQLQHQMEVCQIDNMYYYSFDGTDGVVVVVHRDERYIRHMLEKLEEFWECLQSYTAPALTEKDYQKMSTDDWKQAASELLSISKTLKDLESKKQQLDQKLILMAGNRNSQGAGIKVTKVVRKGLVNYSAIMELQGINLDKYRKDPIEYWKVGEV